MAQAHSVSVLARADYRNSRTVFGIKQPDRLLHMYMVGQTGTGKTTLLGNLIRQDIDSGRGCALLDPHGDLVEHIVGNIPEDMRSRVLYIDAPDATQPFGYNPVRRVVADKRPLAAAGMLEVFKKMWSEAWGVRMEHILRNALLTLLDQPRATLSDLLLLLADKGYRAKAIRNLENERVRTFWVTEFNRYPDRLRAEAVVPIQNKIGALLAHPAVARILTEPEVNLSLRRIMDEGKVLLVNLSKGRLGEDASHLLGGLFATSVGLAAFSRADVAEAARRDFFLYIDEFQNFTTLSLVNMASELRKYHVGLVLANQYLYQLEREIREAVLGNVGTLIAFRLGAPDAVYLAKEFEPVFDCRDLMNLPNHRIYLKLMIDGTPSKPFSGETLEPMQFPGRRAS